MKQHISELEKEYETLCGFGISVSNFLKRQQKSKGMVSEQAVITSMCLKNLLNLLDKITTNKEWMEVSIVAISNL